VSGPLPGRGDEHRSWDELAVGWALHALEPEDETLFAGHLAGCARCARAVAETAEVMAAMAGDLPQAEPSEDLRNRLRAAVENTEQVRPAPRGAVPPSVPPSVPVAVPRVARPAGTPAAGASGELHVPRSVRAVDRRPTWRRVLPTALVAAAVAAVLSLGAWAVVASGDRDAARATAAEQARLLDDLMTPGRATITPVTTQDGRAVATVVARGDQLQVVASGLSVNDTEDEVYVVWGVDGDQPTPLGTFDVVTSAMDLRAVGSSATGLDDFSGYAISIEPGRQAPSSPTDIVATGQVTS
jgi:hypothetical protein